MFAEVPRIIPYAAFFLSVYTGARVQAGLKKKTPTPNQWLTLSMQSKYTQEAQKHEKRKEKNRRTVHTMTAGLLLLSQST